MSRIVVSPLAILLSVPVVSLCSRYSGRYIIAGREVKRLQSIAKPPILEQFRSSLEGLVTIRAYNKTDEYIEKISFIIDRHLTAWWHNHLFRRWLGFRLSMVTNDIRNCNRSHYSFKGVNRCFSCWVRFSICSAVLHYC